MRRICTHFCLSSYLCSTWNSKPVIDCVWKKACFYFFLAEFGNRFFPHGKNINNLQVVDWYILINDLFALSKSFSYWLWEKYCSLCEIHAINARTKRIRKKCCLVSVRRLVKLSIRQIFYAKFHKTLWIHKVVFFMKCPDLSANNWNYWMIMTLIKWLNLTHHVDWRLTIENCPSNAWIRVRYHFTMRKYVPNLISKFEIYCLAYSFQTINKFCFENVWK